MEAEGAEPNDGKVKIRRFSKYSIQLIRIMYGKQCSCHKLLLNTENLRKIHKVEFNLLKTMRDFDNADKVSRRQIER